MVKLGVPHIFTLALVLGIILGLISLFASVQLLPDPCWPNYLQSNYSLVPPIVFGFLGLAALFLLRGNEKAKLLGAAAIFLILFIYLNFLFLNTTSFCGQFIIGKGGVSFVSGWLNVSGLFDITGIEQNSSVTFYNLAMACTILTPSSYQTIKPYPLFFYSNGILSNVLANGNNTISDPFNLASGSVKFFAFPQCYWDNGTIVNNLQIGTATYGYFYMGYTTKKGSISSNNPWNFEKAGIFGVKVI